MWGPSLPGPRGSWGSPQSGEGLWQGLCLEWRGPGNWKGQPKLWMQMRGAVPSPGSQQMGRAGHLVQRGKVDRGRGWSWAEDPGPEWAGHLQSLHSGLAEQAGRGTFREGCGFRGVQENSTDKSGSGGGLWERMRVG